jgi:hypothetical protein
MAVRNVGIPPHHTLHHNPKDHDVQVHIPVLQHSCVLLKRMEIKQSRSSQQPELF